MALLSQKMTSYTHRAFKYKFLKDFLNDVTGVNGMKVNYSTSEFALTKHGLRSCTYSRKLLQTDTTGDKLQLRHFSKENLILEQDGQTLIRSPYKDIHTPRVSFAEYMFTKLDEYKNINCLVSCQLRLLRIYRVIRIENPLNNQLYSQLISISI